MKSTCTHPVTFFFEHAGWSHPAEMTAERDKLLHRVMCAESLAKAERRAHNEGCSFEWMVDAIDSSEWNTEDAPYAQWVCLMKDEDNKVVQSLGGIDFGPESPDPWNKPYKRVVEAELASEHFAT